MLITVKCLLFEIVKKMYLAYLVLMYQRFPLEIPKHQQSQLAS